MWYYCHEMLCFVVNELFWKAERETVLIKLVGFALTKLLSRTLSRTIIRLYPFFKSKQILKSTNTILNIFKYTHPFCTFNHPPLPTLPPRMGIQGPNLYIFVWHPKSKFWNKKFFKISNLKISVCLKKMTPKSQAKNKTSFP